MRVAHTIKQAVGRPDERFSELLSVIWSDAPKFYCAHPCRSRHHLRSIQLLVASTLVMVSLTDRFDLQPHTFAIMSTQDLQWLLLRKTNSYLVKQQGLPRVFSREPHNVLALHSYKVSQSWPSERMHRLTHLSA